MASRPRFGLIGTGYWARAVQLPAAAKSPAVELTAVFGRNRDVAGELAAVHNIAAPATLESFLDAVDIVGIAVAPGAQPDYALPVIAAGKHVLLEKPIAVEPAVADSIVAAIDKAKVAAGVFFTHLLIPRTRAWLDETIATGGWIGARLEGFSRVMIDTSNPYHSAWRGNVGALWDSAPHSVAIAVTVLGEVESVVATKGVGDFKSLTLTHQSGALCTIACSMDAPGPIPGETAFYGAAGKHVAPPSPDWIADANVAYGEALRMLADAAAGRSRDSLPDVGLAAHVTKVLAAAEQSIASGRRISLS